MVCDQNPVFWILKHTVALLCFVVFLLCKEFVEVFVGTWILVFCI
jgi:hypothetical protein